MTDLVKRLRDAAIYGPVPCPVCNEAADAIEARDTEIDWLSVGVADAADAVRRLQSAEVELTRLRQIEEAAQLAYGILWMIDERSPKVRAASNTLRDALGGPSSAGMRKSIERAIAAGYEADHPDGCTWWAGKKD